MRLQRLREMNIRHMVFTAILCLLASIPLISGSLDAASFRHVIVPFVLLCVAAMFYRIKIETVYILYAILWLEAVISTLISPHIGIERTVITYFLFALMVVLFANARFSAADLRHFMNFYICLALVCALLIIATRIADIPHTTGRYSVAILGITKNPNYINSIILLGSAFEFYRLTTDAQGRIVRSLLLAIMLYGCLLTGTRAALLTFILCGIFTVGYVLVATEKGKQQLQFLRRNIKVVLPICAGVIGILILILMFLPLSVTGRFSLDKLFKDNLRLEMWKMSLFQLLKYPILGIGINGTTAYNTTLEFSVTNIHNVMLQFACDQGVIGILIFGRIIRNILHRTQKKDLFLILLISIALYFPILFQNGLVAYTFWWPLLVLEVFTGASKREGLREKL